MNIEVYGKKIPIKICIDKYGLLTLYATLPNKVKIYNQDIQALKEQVVYAMQDDISKDSNTINFLKSF